MEQKRQQILDAINELLEVDGMTQADLAKKLAVSPATIYQVRRENWEDISDKMLNKLMLGLQLTDWKIRNTQNFSTVNRHCGRTQEKSICMAISAQTGRGKTIALKHYVKSSPNAFYIRGKHVHTMKAFVRAIQKSLGLTEGSGVADMMEVIVNHLAGLKKPLLVIDDSHKLKDSCWHIIYDLYESLDGICGIVLSGTENLKKQFDKKVRNDITGFREMYRRISYWEPLYMPDKRIIDTICKDYGITNPGAINFINHRVTNYGELKDIILNAIEVATREEVDVDRELLAGLEIGDMHFTTPI